MAQEANAAALRPQPSPPMPPDQRAQLHVLPLAQCPSLAEFRALLSWGRSTGDANEVSEPQLSEQPPCDVNQLVAMAEWCTALFLTHDRAVAASLLYEDLVAAVRQEQHRVQRAERHASSEPSPGASSPVPSGLDALATRLESAYPFTLISRVGGEIGALRHACEGESIDEASWSVLDPGTSGDKIATYYRRESAGGTHSFLVSGEVAAPMLNLVAMWREASLLHKWLPAVSESSKLASLDDSRYRMLLRVIIDTPWPLSAREAMLYAYGDVLPPDRNLQDGGEAPKGEGEGGSVAVYFRSVMPDEVFTGAGPAGADVTVPPKKSGSVRVDVKVGGFYFTPLPQGRGTRVRALFNLDPKFSVLPFWFLNMMSREFCATIIQIMREKAPRLFANQGSAYAQAMQREARVYGELTSRMREAHQLKQQQEEDQQGKEQPALIEDVHAVPVKVAC